MRNISEQTVERASPGLGWLSRITRLTGVLGAILCLAVLHNPSPAFGATLPVTLAWDASAGSAVAGYRVYYGVASGNYANNVVVGNVTTNTVPGLASGVTYFFAVTCYDTNGLESAFSNEISFVPGLSPVALRITATGQVVLTLNGLAGHTYDIQATPNFLAWTVIGTVTLGANGSLEFTDTNAASFPKRFYRTRDTQL
jgi:hypothetical protein